MIKKAIIAFVITICVLIAGKYGYDYFQEQKAEKEDTYSVMSEYLKEVNSIDEMNKVLDDNEVVYVYMGRPNCGDSDDFEVYFEGMIKEYDLKDKIIYFNIKSITDSNDNYKNVLSNEFGMQNTPTLAKYENGELVLISQWTPAEGYNKDMTLEFLKEANLID